MAEVLRVHHLPSCVDGPCSRTTFLTPGKQSETHNTPQVHSYIPNLTLIGGTGGYTEAPNLKIVVKIVVFRWYLVQSGNNTPIKTKFVGPLVRAKFGLDREGVWAQEPQT